jgi:hypothetical protein
MSRASDRSPEDCPAGAGVDHLTVVPENFDRDSGTSGDRRD